MCWRCVGAVGVAVDGQIQGMLLAHNNPYDVVAGHAIARAAGDLHRLRRRPLTLESKGAMAAVPGIQSELVSLAADLAAAARQLREDDRTNGTSGLSSTPKPGVRQPNPPVRTGSPSSSGYT